MIRGGHLDLCVLGAFQVAENGDIANWATSENDTAPAVGGAMDLAAGAKRLWVLMEHTTKDGTPKLVTKCSYPLTAPGAVKRVYTNLAVLDVTERGFVVRRHGAGPDASRTCRRAPTRSCICRPDMQHEGGCHCGNLQLRLHLTRPPAGTRRGRAAVRSAGRMPRAPCRILAVVLKSTPATGRGSSATVSAPARRIFCSAAPAASTSAPCVTPIWACGR